MAPASPLTGGIQAVRRSVPASAFTSKTVAPTVAQPDSITTSLLNRNSLALGSVSEQISRVSNQVAFLNQGLSKLNSGLSVSATLERQRSQAEAKRQAKLAELKLREGKEGAIENKIQNALQSPVKKIGSKVQFGLQRLANFFTIILGGWIANGTIKLFEALSTGNTEKLKEIQGNILGNLAFVGGSLFLIQGGLLLLSAKVAKLGFAFLKWGGGKLFGKPINYLATLLASQFGRLTGGLAKGGAPVTGALADRVFKSNTGKNVTRVKPGTNVPIIGGAVQVTSDVISGKNIGPSIRDTSVAMTASTITDKAVDRIPMPKKWKFLARTAAGILSWVTSYGLSEAVFGRGEQQKENEVEGDTNEIDSGNIMPSMMSPLDEKEVSKSLQPKREDFGQGRGGAKAFAQAKKDFKLSSAEGIIPVSKQKTIASTIASSSDMDDSPIFVPSPIMGGGTEPSASSSSGSPSRGDGGIPNIPSSNPAVRKYQLVAKKHYQVV
tara:strand:+ start:1870 stop:3354 length:1485 start_codon:yes stop_codon:yes gene_type:complete